MKIVGVGCGPGMLTEEARRGLQKARLVYGSERAIEIARSAIPEGCDVRVIEDYRRLKELPAHAIVLSTGDPMLAGLGYLPGEVVPGVSSLQVACARLKVPLTKIVCVSAHAKDHAGAREEAVDEVRRGKVVFLIADPELNVQDLAAALPTETKIAVCEDLGYPNERIAVGTAAEPPEARGDLFVVLVGEF